MQNFSDWILSSSGTYEWFSTTSTMAVNTSETPNMSSYGSFLQNSSNIKENRSTVTRILSFERALYYQGIHITSSMIAAIKAKKKDPSDIFITLSQSTCSPPLVMPQLLAAILKQLLLSQPQLVVELRPLLAEAQIALRGNDTTWSKELLWRCLKSQVHNSSLGRVFLVIQEPDNLELAAPYQELRDSLEVFLSNMGVHWKMIIIRMASPGPSTTLDLAVRTINISDEGLIAAQKDFETTGDMLHQHKYPHIGSKRARNILGASHKSPQDAKIVIAPQYAIKKLKKIFSFMHGDNPNKLSHILNRIPTELLPQVRIGLLWVYYAVRPLSLDELDEILRRGWANSWSSTSRYMVASQFVEMFPGILEVDGDKIMVWRRDLTDPSIFLNVPDKKAWIDDNLIIALVCVRYLLEHLGEIILSQEVPQSEDRPPISYTLWGKEKKWTSRTENSKAFLRYAVEHWFAHFKASTGHCHSSVLGTGSFASFLESRSQVKLWLRLRESYRALDPNTCPLIYLPTLSEVENVLNIPTIEALDLLLLTSGVGASLKTTGYGWPSMAVAAAQHGNIDILRKLNALGHLSEKETLMNIFKTGNDDILCQLVYDIGHTFWSKMNIDHVLGDAIRRGIIKLAEVVVKGYRDLLKFEGYPQPLLQIAAEKQVSWPRILLDTQISFINHRDQELKSKTPLHLAVKSGNHNLISWILEHSPDKSETVNIPDSSGISPLHLAAKYGDIAIMTQLLDAQADISAADRDNKTPLHEAVENGHSGIVYLLLQRGSKINARSSGNKTPLHIALENYRPNIALLLLDYVPNNAETFEFDIQNSDGATPLILAVERNYFVVVRVLLERGAEADMEGPRGRTALHLAAKFGQDHILNILLENNAYENHTDLEGNTALHLAARRGHGECIKRLLEAKASPDIRARDGLTPLDVACSRGQTSAAEALIRPCQSLRRLDVSFLYAIVSQSFDIARLLLNEGADKNAKNKIGETALHLAAINSDTKTMELLLFRRADLETRDRRQQTPLMVAVRKNSIPCVQMLLDAGANPDTQDDHRYTPIFYACRTGADNMVELLLKAKAPLKGRGLSTLDDFLMFAFTNFLPSVVKIIAQHAIKISRQPGLVSPTAIPHIIRHRKSGLVDIVNIMIENGLDLTEPVQDQETILHKAAEEGAFDLVELLIPLVPQDLDKTNEKNGTPLQVAASRGHDNIVKVLLEHGADPAKGSGRFGAPLHAAVSLGGNRNHGVYHDGFSKTIRLLLTHEKGEDLLNQQAGYFGSVLQAAADAGIDIICEKLLLFKAYLDLKQLSGAHGTPFHMAVFAKNRNIVNLFLEEAIPELSPETLDQEGRLPVHLAASVDRADMVTLLTNEKTTVLARDYQGRHTLHFAAASGSVKTARMILDEHEDAVNDEDCDGWTPLHFACRQESKKMIKCLVRRGADRNKETDRGWRPFHVALYTQKIFENDWEEVRDILEVPDQEIRDAMWRKQPEVVQSETTSAWIPRVPAYDNEESFPVRISQSAGNGDYSCGSCNCVSLLPNLPTVLRNKENVVFCFC